MANLGVAWMASFTWPLVFGGPFPPLQGVAPMEGGLLLVGRDFLAWNGVPGGYTASQAGFDRLFGPAVSPDGRRAAVWAGSDGRNGIILLSEGGVEVLGPYGRAGLPCWDGAGNLWFTADGELTRNGVPTGLRLDAHHISINPPGDLLVFTDRLDRILTADPAGHQVDTLSGAFRFYGPFFAGENAVVSPSLDGGIWWFEDGEAVFVDHGEHPAWWPEREALVYARTTDDGLHLTSSDLWLWTRGSGVRRLTDTPHRLEVHPAPAPRGVYYVDAMGDTAGFLEVPQ